MKFIDNINPVVSCPVCPLCDQYNSCYCDFIGIEIVDRSLSDWGHSGYKISAAIASTANETGVTVPGRKIPMS